VAALQVDPNLPDPVFDSAVLTPWTALSDGQPSMQVEAEFCWARRALASQPCAWSAAIEAGQSSMRRMEELWHTMRRFREMIACLSGRAQARCGIEGHVQVGERRRWRYGVVADGDRFAAGRDSADIVMSCHPRSLCRRQWAGPARPAAGDLASHPLALRRRLPCLAPCSSLPGIAPRSLESGRSRHLYPRIRSHL
jgi:hypothetical protein